MVVEPYLMDSSIPQYALAGEVVVAGLSIFRVSMEILESELSDHACLHGCDRSRVLSGVGATEGQLAILAVVGRRGLKRHGNQVRWDGPLAE